MKNIKIFIVYIYSLPTLISLVLIYTNKTLLGDFRTYHYILNAYEGFQIFLTYISSLMCIYLFLFLFKKVILVKPKDDFFYDKFIPILFCYIFVITFFFGAVQVGVLNSGLFGLMKTLVAKLNPNLLLLILAFYKVPVRKFIFCSLVCLFYGLMQGSLQGYLVVFFAAMIFILNTYKISMFKMLIILLLPMVLSYPIFELLTFMYKLRGESRGISFDIDNVMLLAVGRISSISSYLYIKDNSFNFDAISTFFSVGTILERAIGVSPFTIISPSEVFNSNILGITGYSIFLGLNGFIYSLWNASSVTCFINITFLMLCLLFIYSIIPCSDNRNRIVVFFTSIFFVLLSSDVWELSILLQSIVIINIVYLIFKKTYRFLATI